MPDEIQKICKAYMNDPKTIAIDSDTKTVDSITQTYVKIEANEKRTQLERILYAEKPKSCIIFCNMRIEVDKVQNFLYRQGFVSEAIHGANTQSKRMRTIDNFKNGDIQILVATDVAARGLHIDDMEMVINYDMPVEKDSYVHRIGRTGRAGNGGKALNLVTSDDMYAFYEIEEHAGAMIEEVDLPTDEAVEAGKAEIDVIWADKRAKRKKPEPARVSSHNKGNNRSSNRPSRPEHKTHKPRHNDTRHSDTRNNEKRDRPSREHKPKHIHNERIEKREHPVVHQEPVRRVIEENFIPNRRKVVHPPKVEKKKFSLRRLFRK